MGRSLALALRHRSSVPSPSNVDRRDRISFLLSFPVPCLTRVGSRRTARGVLLRPTYRHLFADVEPRFWRAPLSYIVFSWYGFTKGDDGIQGLLPPPFLREGVHYYYFTLLVVGIALLFLWRITRSPFGYSLRMLRDNQHRAAFLGINVRQCMLMNFIIRIRFRRDCRSAVESFSAKCLTRASGLDGVR